MALCRSSIDVSGAGMGNREHRKIRSHNFLIDSMGTDYYIYWVNKKRHHRERLSTAIGKTLKLLREKS